MLYLVVITRSGQCYQYLVYSRNDIGLVSEGLGTYMFDKSIVITQKPEYEIRAVSVGRPSKKLRNLTIREASLAELSVRISSWISI